MNQEIIRVSTKVIIHAGNARTQINDALKAARIL
jgi:cellobiose-specific phosphotransferase system component IIA